MAEIKRVTRRSSRPHKRIDYVALNESHRIQELNKHPHIEEFEKFNNNNNNNKPLDELICLIDQSNEKSKQYFDSNGELTDSQLQKIINETKLLKPILIRGANPNVPETYNSNIKLSFNIPKYDIEKITEKIGFDRKVPVMDVMTQNNSPKWDMKRWCNYFKLDKSNRDKIRNVISLEISDTELGNEIVIPKVVSDLDIILKLFNDDNELLNLLNDNNVYPPKVRKYILMSVANSYTDFHIDFAGTSVYYSPINGHKQFILIPPLKKNLEIYKKWCLSDDQNNIWLPSLIKNLNFNDLNKLKFSNKNIPNAYLNNGFLIDILPGDLLLLPSMWIHSVYTKEDSIIIGGNFLNLLSLENHLETYKIEIETKVNDQFKFPNFVKFIWLIAYYLMNNIKFENDNFKLNCYKSLIDFLKQQWIYVNDLSHKNKREKNASLKIKYSIPTQIVGNIDIFLQKMDIWYASINDEDHAESDLKRRKV